MTGYNLLFHAYIVIDYTEAYQWYEDQNKGSGENFLNTVANKIIQIESNPEIYGVKYKSGLP